MTKDLAVEDIGHGPSLCVFLDGVPADDAVRAEGHEPNGYFWQGVAEFVRGDLSLAWSSTVKDRCSWPTVMPIC